MAEKKAFILRVNPDVLKEIESWAGDEFRSTNGQIEYLLQQALNERRKKAEGGGRKSQGGRRKAEDGQKL